MCEEEGDGQRAGEWIHYQLVWSACVALGVIIEIYDYEYLCISCIFHATLSLSLCVCVSVCCLS